MLRRLLILLAVLAVLIAGLLVFRRPPGAATTTWEAQAVRRGTITEQGHENGTLAPRTPTIATAPFEARLSWLVEDATWVEAGAPLAILADDDEMRRLAEERSQLEDARQELAVARLKRQQEADEQEAKVAVAVRAANLERGRHRVATTTAVGGEELVRLADALAPVEERLRGLRREARAAQETWQAAEDVHLDALGRWQEAQDAVLRLEARLQDLVQEPQDGAKTESRASVADTGQGARAQRRRQRAASEAGQEATTDIAALRRTTETDLAAARTRVQELGAAAEQARAAADALRPARDRSVATLTEGEDGAIDLRLRLEVERRALPATTLALDRDAARLDLAEADRRLADGRAAFAAKALSQAALDDLTAAQADATARLQILEQRLAVAAAPPAPEAVAEAAARLAKVEADEAAARAERTRSLAILDQGIAVAEAKVRRGEAVIAQRSRRFPATIQGELEARRRELAEPGADREALAKTIATLEQDLARAKATPPNVVSAPVAGLARLRRDNNRVRQAGDQVGPGDPLVEVHPPGNLEVLVRVNESVVGRYAAGMPVHLTIPALGDLARTGSIASVAGVGRDKSVGTDSPTYTGVTQFDVRIALNAEAQGRDGDLRQGMTALVTIDRARHEGVLWLPRAAARHAGGRWFVRRSPEAAPVAADLTPAGDDVLLVNSGLVEGDQVFIERTAP